MVLMSTLTNSVYASEEETGLLTEVSKQFGAETDYFTFPNYATLVNTSKDDEKYIEFLKSCTNSEMISGPSDDYISALHSGRCMGISLLEILSHNGILRPSDIQSGANNLTDITLDNEVKDLMSCYQILQCHTEFDLYMKWFLSHYSNNDKNRILLDTAEKCTKEGKYFLAIYDAPEFSHAVVGIGMTDGDWTFNGEKYDKCILTYDSNAIKAEFFPQEKVAWGFTEELSIYINSETNRIYVPGYDLGTDSGLTFFTTDDETLLNYKGKINPSEIINTDLSLINKIKVSGSGEYTITAQKSDNIYYDVVAGSFKNYPQKDSISYYSSGKNFYVKNIDNSELDVTFTDTAHSVIVDTTGNVNNIYKNDSEIKVSNNGEKIDYCISFILNEGNYDFTPHYRWIFDGATESDITVKQTDKGMLLNSTNVIECQVTTYDVAFDDKGCVKDTESNCHIIDLYSNESVMIYFNENDELQYYEVASGDINADGNISIADAVSLQNYLMGREDGLINWKSADICKDNEINVFDMILMRRLLVNKA